MATHQTTIGLEKLTPGGSRGDLLDHMPEQFGALYQSAYEAGYRQGFRDGFTDGAELRQKDNGRCHQRRRQPNKRGGEFRAAASWSAT